jgi:mRNA interferase MazF
MLDQGAIVLIPVPFTDLSSTKRRPVIVISSTTYNQTTSDMIVVAMTSNPAQTPYSFTITNQDLIEGSLNRPGQVRTDKIYTLSQHIAVRVFGKVKTETIERIKVLLDKATDIERSSPAASDHDDTMT